MRAEGKEVSIVKLCRWFDVPRSTFYYEPKIRKPAPIDTGMATVIRKIIDENPAFGVRMITATARREVKGPVNRKKVCDSACKIDPLRGVIGVQN